MTEKDIKSLHITFRRLLALCVTLVATCFYTSSAYAVASLTLENCAASGGFPPEALTGPIVYCIETTIRDSVVNALQDVSDYFKGVTSVIFVLAVTIHGARMISGERGLNGKSIVLMVKIGLVAHFSYNLGGYAARVFELMDEVVYDAVGNFSPWSKIDDILGTLFGFAPGILLSQGLIWLAAGLTSGWDSVPMSSALIVMFIELILFVIEIIYVFLTSFLVVAFMLVLSPMFVPMIIFQVSERYFKKWLDTIIGAMLIPVLVFAAMSFSLLLFKGRIEVIFKTILPEYNFTLPPDPANPPDFSSLRKINQSMFSTTMGVDTNFLNMQQKALDRNPGKTQIVPSAHTVINPFNRGGFEINLANPPQIDFGVSHREMNQDLLLALVTLWLYIAIMKQLIEKMPEIAEQITNSGMGIVLSAPKLQQKVAEFKGNLSGGAGVLAGGLAGNQLGALSGSSRVTGAGAIGGAAIGHVIARKAL